MENEGSIIPREPTVSVRGGECLRSNEGEEKLEETVKERDTLDSVWQLQVIHERMEVEESSADQQKQREIKLVENIGHDLQQFESDNLINIPIELFGSKGIL